MANGFNKSKQDFIWFVKRATIDRKGDAHAELYHCLLKIFVDADTNRDGMVSKADFSNLVDMAVSIPRMYGYAPLDADLYKTQIEKEKARQKMFDSMDKRGVGAITFDEWYKFSMEHIASKTATIELHPRLDHACADDYLKFVKAAVNTGTKEHTEMFWYLVEMFTEFDTNKDGTLSMRSFPKMVDRLMLTPKKMQVEHPSKVNRVKNCLILYFMFILQELYMSGEPKIKCLEKMFASATRTDGQMTLDEWVTFALESIFKQLV